MRNLFLCLSTIALFGKTLSQDYFFIQLSSTPVKITSQPVVVNPKESGNAQEITKCTISFWVHFNPKSLTNEIHLLSVRNRPTPKKVNPKTLDNANSTLAAFPDTSQCPYRSDDILSDPTIIEQIDFKLNPHCKYLEELLTEFADHPKELLTFKITRVDSKLELVISYPQGKTGAGKPFERGTDEFKLTDDHADNWFFIVFSVDFKDGNGNSFLEFVNTSMQQHKRRFNFVHLDHSFAKDFYFLFSDNHQNIRDKSSIKAMMYKPKFYPECFDHSDLLLVSNQEIRLTTEALLMLDVSFTRNPSNYQSAETPLPHQDEIASALNKPLSHKPESKVGHHPAESGLVSHKMALKSTNSTQNQEKNDTYSFLIKNKEYPNSFVEHLPMNTNFEIAIKKLLEKEEQDKFFFAQSPSFFFEVETLRPRMDQAPIFTFLNETAQSNITLSLSRYQKDDGSFCKFTISAAKDPANSFAFVTPAYEISGQTIIMTFSVVNFFNKFTKFVLIVNQKYRFVSQSLGNVKFDLADFNLRLPLCEFEYTG